MVVLASATICTGKIPSLQSLSYEQSLFLSLSSISPRPLKPSTVTVQPRKRFNVSAKAMKSESGANTKLGVAVYKPKSYEVFVLDAAIKLCYALQDGLQGGIENSCYKTTYAYWEGFEYHHAEKSYVMMTYCIPDGPSLIPCNVSHHVGVDSFVINEKDEAKLNTKSCFSFVLYEFVFSPKKLSSHQRNFGLASFIPDSCKSKFNLLDSIHSLVFVFV